MRQRPIIQTITGKGITQQHFGNEVNVNTIMKRSRGRAVGDPELQARSFFGDFSASVDYQTAMDIVRRSTEAFMTLPAQTRKRFGNSPQQLIEFMEDDRNLDEAIKLGLAKAKDVPIKKDEPVKPAASAPTSATT